MVILFTRLTEKLLHFGDISFQISKEVGWQILSDESHTSQVPVPEKKDKKSLDKRFRLC